MVKEQLKQEEVGPLLFSCEKYIATTGPPDKSETEIYFSYFSTKTYVMGTQKNHLNEMALLSTQNMFKLIDREKTTFLLSKFVLNGTYGYITFVNLFVK